LPKGTMRYVCGVVFLAVLFFFFGARVHDVGR